MLYLARHGQDEDNANGILNGRRDAPLTNVGIEQAKILAQAIKNLDLTIDRIYSSPLQRTYKTAVIIADILGLTKPKSLNLLIERDFGVMTGKPVKSIKTLCFPDIIRSNTATYFLAVEGSETFPELINRARQLLKWLNSNNVDENTLLVSHGDIGKMIYAAFYNLDWKDVLTKFHFGNSELILFSKNSKLKERHIYKAHQHNC